MDNRERKEVEQDLKDAAENEPHRVTLAIAEKSAEMAFCDGYRTGVFDMAAIALAALSVYAIVRILASGE